MDLITVIGIAASVFTAVSLVPQLVKLLKEKKAESVSIGMLAILFAGIALWTYYGFLKKDLIIIISNSFSIIINSVLTFFTVKYKKQPAD